MAILPGLDEVAASANLSDTQKKWLAGLTYFVMLLMFLTFCQLLYNVWTILYR